METWEYALLDSLERKKKVRSYYTDSAKRQAESLDDPPSVDWKKYEWVLPRNPEREEELKAMDWKHLEALSGVATGRGNRPDMGTAMLRVANHEGWVFQDWYLQERQLSTDPLYRKLRCWGIDEKSYRYGKIWVPDWEARAAEAKKKWYDAYSELTREEKGTDVGVPAVIFTVILALSALVFIVGILVAIVSLLMSEARSFVVIVLAVVAAFICLCVYSEDVRQRSEGERSGIVKYSAVEELVREQREHPLGEAFPPEKEETLRYKEIASARVAAWDALRKAEEEGDYEEADKQRRLWCEAEDACSKYAINAMPTVLYEKYEDFI